MCTPLNIAGLQRDVLAVCAANHCACTDLDIVSNQCAGNHCAIADRYAGHQNRIDNLSTLAYGSTGEDYRILNSSVYARTLRNVSTIDRSIGSDISPTSFQ